MEELLKILNDIRPDIDFETKDNLLDSGVIDSFDVVMMVPELNDFYNINIPIPDINAENFRNVNTILAMIERIKGS